MPTISIHLLCKEICSDDVVASLVMFKQCLCGKLQRLVSSTLALLEKDFKAVVQRTVEKVGIEFLMTVAAQALYRR